MSLSHQNVLNKVVQDETVEQEPTQGVCYLIWSLIVDFNTAKHSSCRWALLQHSDVEGLEGETFLRLFHGHRITQAVRSLNIVWLSCRDPGQGLVVIKIRPTDGPVEGSESSSRPGGSWAACVQQCKRSSCFFVLGGIDFLSTLQRRCLKHLQQMSVDN